MFKCQECGTVKVKDFKVCECGWSKQDVEVRRVVRTCEFENNGKRCPLPGTISPSIREGGSFYCSYHFQSPGGDAEILMRYISKYFLEIIHEMKCASRNFYYHAKECGRCADWQKIKNLGITKAASEELGVNCEESLDF